MQSLPLWREINDNRNVATTLNDVGNIYAGLGLPQQALKFYEEALPLRRLAGDKRGEAATLSGIGRAIR